MPATASPSNTSRILYEQAIVVDATAPLAPFSYASSTLGPEKLISPYAKAGVTLAVFTLVDDYPYSIEQTVKLLAANRRFVFAKRQQLCLADGAADVREAKRERKLAIAFAFQGSSSVMGDLALVEVYRRLGVIQLALAYNCANFAADGCHESRNSGLTSFGRKLIGEMNRVGMILDLTHVGLRSSMEALEITTRPPVFSHSTPKRFAPHDRNITDEQIRACAAKGGVICLSGVGLFMDRAAGLASTSKLVDTIEYVADLVGPKHVGLGLDYVMDTELLARFITDNPDAYGGGVQYPSDGRIDFASPAVLCEIAGQLSARGYVDDDIRGMLGENYLRVMEANQ